MDGADLTGLSYGAAIFWGPIFFLQALQPAQVNILRTEDGNYTCNEGQCAAQFKTYASAVDHRLSTHVFVSILQAQPSVADGAGHSPGDDHGDHDDGDGDGDGDEDDDADDDASESGPRARRDSLNTAAAAAQHTHKRMRVEHHDPASAPSPQRPGLHLAAAPPSSLLTPGWHGSRHELPAVSFDGRTLPPNGGIHLLRPPPPSASASGAGPGMAPHAGHLFAMVDGRLVSMTDGGLPVYLVSGHRNARDDLLLPGATAISGGWPPGPLPPLPPLPPTASGTPPLPPLPTTSGAPSLPPLPPTASGGAPPLQPATSSPWGPFYASPAAVHHPAAASVNLPRDSPSASTTPLPTGAWSTFAPSYPQTAPSSPPPAASPKPVRRASAHATTAPSSPPASQSPARRASTHATTAPAPPQPPPTVVPAARPLAESASAAVTPRTTGGGSGGSSSTRRRSSSNSAETAPARRSEADAASSSVDSDSQAAELEARLQALTAQGARLRHYQIYMMSMSREVHSIQGRIRPQVRMGEAAKKGTSEEGKKERGKGRRKEGREEGKRVRERN